MKQPRSFRYPGSQPFTRKDAHIFFGRDRDAKRLAAQIQLEEMIVLYGRSGLGKSSLLNAAVVPKLTEEKGVESISAHVVPIRLGGRSESGGQVFSPVENVVKRIRAEGRKDDWTYRFDDESAAIWLALKSIQTAHPEKYPLLIIDQFEELFSYRTQEIDAFARLLAQGLYERVPQAIRNALERGEVELTSEEREALFKPLEMKVVFAIRSDRMSFLDSLKGYLPDILRKTYQLKPLTKEQAEEAIVNPAYSQDEGFVSSSFDYTDEALDKILDFLSKEGKSDIESTQLQIICQHAEHLVIDGEVSHKTGAGVPQIYPEDLGELKQIYRGHYKGILDDIKNKKSRLAVQELVEEDLIFEKDKIRVPVYQGQIESKGISKKLLDLLVNKYHLLRAERNMSGSGGFNYELSHDTLIEPILAVKQERLEKARLDEAAKERREAIERAAEAEAKAQEEKEARAKAVENEKRARESEKRAKESEQRALESEKQARESEKHAKESEKRALKSEKQARESEKHAKESEQRALESEKQARESEKHAKESEQRALESEKQARESEKHAKESEQRALESEQLALESEKRAKQSAKISRILSYFFIAAAFAVLYYGMQSSLSRFNASRSLLAAQEGLIKTEISNIQVLNVQEQRLEVDSSTFADAGGASASELVRSVNSALAGLNRQVADAEGERDRLCSLAKINEATLIRDINRKSWLQFMVWWTVADSVSSPWEYKEVFKRDSLRFDDSICPQLNDGL